MANTTPLVDVNAGWTAPLGPFTLSIDGVPQNLTGLTIELIMRRSSGVLVNVTGTIEVMDQGTHVGKVMYNPAAGDFTWEENMKTAAQEYLIHWKATDGVPRVAFFPNGAPAIIRVWRA